MCLYCYCTVAAKDGGTQLYFSLLHWLLCDHYKLDAVSRSANREGNNIGKLNDIICVYMNSLSWSYFKVAVASQLNKLEINTLTTCICHEQCKRLKTTPSPLDLVPAAEAVWCQCSDFPTVLQHSCASWQGQLPSSRCMSMPAEILPWACTKRCCRAQTLLNSKVKACSSQAPGAIVSRQTSTGMFVFFLNKE